MEGKRGRGRSRQKLLDWMMSERYSKLKEEAQHHEMWSHWKSGPARGQRTYRRRRSLLMTIRTRQRNWMGHIISHHHYKVILQSNQCCQNAGEMLKGAINTFSTCTFRI